MEHKEYMNYTTMSAMLFGCQNFIFLVRSYITSFQITNGHRVNKKEKRFKAYLYTVQKECGISLAELEICTAGCMEIDISSGNHDIF